MRVLLSAKKGSKHKFSCVWRFSQRFYSVDMNNILRWSLGADDLTKIEACEKIEIGSDHIEQKRLSTTSNEFSYELMSKQVSVYCIVIVLSLGHKIFLGHGLGEIVPKISKKGSGMGIQWLRIRIICIYW